MENLQSNLFYSLAGVATLASFASCTGKQKSAEQPPLNIVYIMTDDHTAQMMSCYDTRYMETPNLDRIAADGVRFTNLSKTLAESRLSDCIGRKMAFGEFAVRI